MEVLHVVTDHAVESYIENRIPTLSFLDSVRLELEIAQCQ
jgi:hypothetical protein